VFDREDLCGLMGHCGNVETQRADLRVWLKGKAVGGHWRGGFQR